MEERNFDFNSLIGIMLIGILLMFWISSNTQIETTISENENIKSDSIEITDNTKKNISLDEINENLFANEFEVNSINELEFKNETFNIKFSEAGGQISELALNEYVNYKGAPIYLIKDGNSTFNLDFKTSNNRQINTKDQDFNASRYKDGDNEVISMKLFVSDERYLEYLYTIKPEEYLIDVKLQSKGFSDLINQNEDYNLSWKLNGIRNSKSISYENRYTRLTYYHDGDKIDKLSQMGDDEDQIKDVNWISFRQHFFSSIIIPSETAFQDVRISSKDLVEDESVDTLYTKQYIAQVPFSYKENEINDTFRIYFGPTDNNVFKDYDLDLDQSIPFGWGIFGAINKRVFVPLFRWLSSIFPYGIAIIIMTIIVRLILAPVLYKSYLSQAKMKILKPDVEELNKKFKDNPMKRQQEMMSLYSKAGASPMGGCLPALLQIPVFYALFMFFPSAFDLRQKSFLWADDLSAYDSILDLPFTIWGYGDHVSLFPILAAVSIFFYMQMTMGQQTASQPPPQEGMPDMTKMMKYMMYISPLFMLIFFNNYASGLSLYYFISNILSISIMFTIKNYILDERKIRDQIQIDKAKPDKAPSRFQRKMQELMEEAERQKKNQNKN